MTTWEKRPPYQGEIHQGCLSCSPVQEIASMNMLIAVGFGDAHASRDGEIIYHEKPDDDKSKLLSEFEAMAKKDPDHDWRVMLFAPLRGREYQRQGDELWVLIDSNPGIFAD